MNLFRSEEHVKNWSLYDPVSADAIMPLALGTGLQRAAGSQSAGTGLSLAEPGIQVRVIPCVTEAGQDGPVLAAKVVPCRKWDGRPVEIT